MSTKSRPRLSVVTATYNVVNDLPRLIESLHGQTDRDFEWVVADGASTDGTLELLQAIAGIRVVISSQPDFGIYDALNRAIKASTGEYYVVAGADDFFYSDAIANFRRAIDQSGTDIVSASAMYGKKCLKVKNGPSWLFAGSSFIAAHTLGTAFRKDLHRVFGYYSKKYSIAADHLFVMQVCNGGASLQRCNFVAGEIGSGGVSSVDRIGTAAEVFRVQVAQGHSIAVQMLLLLLRVLRSG